MAPSPEKGFFVACYDLNVTQRYVVYPGTERFLLRQGAQAIGLQEMGSCWPGSKCGDWKGYSPHKLRLLNA